MWPPSNATALYFTCIFPISFKKYMKKKTIKRSKINYSVATEIYVTCVAFYISVNISADISNDHAHKKTTGVCD